MKEQLTVAELKNKCVDLKKNVIDMIHLGVVMIVNLAIGLFTPPVGVNLYVACGVANVDLKQISKAVVPLLIASLIVLLIITYIPGISTVFTS